jgi:hypothetical protein
VLTVLLTWRCDGGNLPSVAEAIIVDSTITVEPGQFMSYRFSVDLNVMGEPFAFVGFESDGGTTVAKSFIMTENDFQAWESGQAFTAGVQSALIPATSIQWLIPASGDYRVVYSNRDDEVRARVLGVFATLFWTP